MLMICDDDSVVQLGGVQYTVRSPGASPLTKKNKNTAKKRYVLFLQPRAGCSVVQRALSYPPVTARSSRVLQACLALPAPIAAAPCTGWLPVGVPMCDARVSARRSEPGAVKTEPNLLDPSPAPPASANTSARQGRQRGLINPHAPVLTITSSDDTGGVWMGQGDHHDDADYADYGGYVCPCRGCVAVRLAIPAPCYAIALVRHVAACIQRLQ